MRLRDFVAAVKEAQSMSPSLLHLDLELPSEEDLAVPVTPKTPDYWSVLNDSDIFTPGSVSGQDGSTTRSLRRRRQPTTPVGYHSVPPRTTDKAKSDILIQIGRKSDRKKRKNYDKESPLHNDEGSTTNKKLKSEIERQTEEEEEGLSGVDSELAAPIERKLDLDQEENIRVVDILTICERGISGDGEESVTAVGNRVCGVESENGEDSEGGRVVRNGESCETISRNSLSVNGSRRLSDGRGEVLSVSVGVREREEEARNGGRLGEVAERGLDSRDMREKETTREKTKMEEREKERKEEEEIGRKKEMREKKTKMEERENEGEEMGEGEGESSSSEDDDLPLYETKSSTKVVGKNTHNPPKPPKSGSSTLHWNIYSMNIGWKSITKRCVVSPVNDLKEGEYIWLKYKAFPHWPALVCKYIQYTALACSGVQVYTVYCIGLLWCASIYSILHWPALVCKYIQYTALACSGVQVYTVYCIGLLWCASIYSIL